MRFTQLLILALLIEACMPVPTPEPTSTPVTPLVLVTADNPYGPQPGDGSLQVATVDMTSIDLVERFDLDPTRVELRILGSVPSVCNELRVEVSLPDDNYQIFVEVYSLVNSKVDCDNVFQQFEATILLGVYSNGRYTVWVNNGLIGDFVTY